jgi:hypothetical protein
LLREHQGDGHIAALMVEGVSGLEAHVLFALDMDMPAEKFGRIHHLTAAQLAAVIDGMRARDLIGDDGWLSEQGANARSGCVLCGVNSGAVDCVCCHAIRRSDCWSRCRV